MTPYPMNTLRLEHHCDAALPALGRNEDGRGSCDAEGCDIGNDSLAGCDGNIENGHDRTIPAEEEEEEEHYARHGGIHIHAADTEDNDGRDTAGDNDCLMLCRIPWQY